MGNFLESLWDSTLGAVFNFGTDAIGAGLDSLGLSRHGRDQYFQRDFAREQMDWQSGENQKNRDFSMEMYNKQFADYLAKYPELLRMQQDAQFNTWKNQFDMQNAYNDPRNQVQRQMSAGLNPIGNNGVTGVNQMGASASVSPPPQIHGSPLGGSASPVGIPQGMSGSGSTLEQVGSFLKDLAESKYLGSRKIGQDIENKYSDETLRDRIEKVALDNKWTKEQTALIIEQFAEVNAKINLLNSETKLNDVKTKRFNEEMDAKINDLKKSAEYKDALTQLTDKQRELFESMFDDLKNYQMYSTQLIERMVTLSKRYGDAQAVVGLISDVVKSAVDVYGAVSGTKKVVDVFKHD